MPGFKKTNGRPPKITDEIVEKITNAMRMGAYIETAAAYCNVDKKTLYTWMKKGNVKPKSKYGRFLLAVDRAFADCELRDLLAIERAASPNQIALPVLKETGKKDTNGKPITEQLKDADGNPMWILPQKPDWSASAWRMERRNPKNWSRTERIENTGKDGGPQVIITLPQNGREKPGK